MNSCSGNVPTDDEIALSQATRVKFADDYPSGYYYVSLCGNQSIAFKDDSRYLPWLIVGSDECFELDEDFVVIAPVPEF